MEINTSNSRVSQEELIDMMNILDKFKSAEENAPGKLAPQVVMAVQEFMQRLTLSDCESFAREIRRIMDDIVEIKSR